MLQLARGGGTEAMNGLAPYAVFFGAPPAGLQCDAPALGCALERATR